MFLKAIYIIEQKKLITIIKNYNNRMNSLNLLNRMYTIFRNDKNSKTSVLHLLLLNLTDRINLQRSDKMLLYQIVAFITHE